MTNGSKRTCDDWVFDDSVFSNTIISQFSLVCEKKLSNSHAVATYFIGQMASPFLLIPIGDIIGRRLLACITLTLVFAVNIAMPFSNSLALFAVFRFLDGLLAASLYTTSFVIGIELLGALKRKIAATVILLVYCLGEFVLVVLAYFIRDWRWLQVTVALPMALPLIYWWFVIAFIYNGIKMNIGKLGGDLYVSFTLVVVAETLGYSLLFTMDIVGHKRLHMIVMVTACIACIASVFPILFSTKDLQWLVVLFALLGKLSVSAGYGMVYVFTGEIFPTVVRQFSLGSCAVFARIGSICAPYLYHLAEGKMKKALPLILYGVIVVVVTLLTIILPETSGRKLPDYVKESEIVDCHKGQKKAVKSDDEDNEIESDL